MLLVSQQGAINGGRHDCSGCSHKPWLRASVVRVRLGRAVPPAVTSPALLRVSICAGAAQGFCKAAHSLGSAEHGSRTWRAPEWWRWEGASRDPPGQPLPSRVTQSTERRVVARGS